MSPVTLNMVYTYNRALLLWVSTDERRKWRQWRKKTSLIVTGTRDLWRLSCKWQQNLILRKQKKEQQERGSSSLQSDFLMFGGQAEQAD